MHLKTFAEMPLATSYSPLSFLVVYSIVEPNILKIDEYKFITLAHYRLKKVHPTMILTLALHLCSLCHSQTIHIWKKMRIKLG